MTLRSFRSLALILGATALCAPLAYYAMFNTFSGYDDEGYFLVSIKVISQGQSLYGDAIIPYGPFYYVLFVPLFKVIGVSHDAGRLVVLIAWLTCTALGGLLVKRLTGSVLVALITMAALFRTLASLRVEPMNPAAVLELLLLFMLAAALAWERRPRALVVMGALGAAALLVKINIGGYALLAAVFMVMARSPMSAWVWWAGGAGIMAVVPLAVLSHDLGDPAVRRYAAITALSGVAVVFAARVGGTRDRPLAPSFVLLAVGGASTAVAISAIAMAFFGLTPATLWYGVVTLAARVHDAYRAVLDPGLRPTLVAVLAAPFAARFAAVESAWSALLRLGAGLLIVGAALDSQFAGLNWTPVEWGLPLAWLAALPSPHGTDRFRSARVFAVALAVLESLYAYPVAGQQRSFAAAVLIPVAGILIGDAWQIGRRALERAGPVRPSLIRSLAVVPAVAALLAAAVLQLPEQRRAYRNNVAAPFVGASLLRMPWPDVQRFRWYEQHTQDCTTFVPYLSLQSFYLFSEKPAPTSFPQSWPRTLDLKSQERIVAKLKRIPKLCALVDREAAKFWLGRRPPPAGPLLNYLRSEMRVAALSKYGRVLVRRKDGSPGTRAASASSGRRLRKRPVT